MSKADLALINRYSRGAKVEVSPGLAQFQADRVADLVGRLRPEHGSAILGDPVGTGKTVVALAAAVRLLSAGHIKHVLVIAPNKTVAEIWRDRARFFDDDDLMAALEVVAASATPHRRLRPSLVIVDEAHRRLNRNIVDKLLRSGPGGSHRRLLITATPFQIQVSMLKELIELGDHEHAHHVVVTKLEEFGHAVTRLAKQAGTEKRDGHLATQLEQAARSWRTHQATVMVRPPTAVELRAVGLRRPTALEAHLVPLPAKWEQAFHVARLIPELLNPDGAQRSGASDAFQRGLASSAEAFHAHAAGRAFENDKRLRSLRVELDRSLGEGPSHPKVAATADWVEQQAGSGNHVAIFCVWTATAEALTRVLRARLNRTHPEVLVNRPPGVSVPSNVAKRFRSKTSDPVVLILQDRFAESIDLDGGAPALVHHDLPWNPARLRQRWGRFVRAGTGFTPIPKAKLFVPVLDHETDRRVFATVTARANISDVLLADSMALRDEGDAELEVTDWIIKALEQGMTN